MPLVPAAYSSRGIFIPFNCSFIFPNPVILFSPDAGILYKLKTRKGTHLSKLLLENLLHSDGVGSKLADTFTELGDGHGLLVKVEAEGRLVLEVGLALNVLGGGLGRVELLGNVFVAVKELLEQTGLRAC